jgi:hypothetical protein
VTAATIASFGLPAWRYLTTTDREERLVLEAVCKAAIKMQEKANRG